MKTEDLLRAPYKRVLIPDEESGTWTSEIAEFPGCVSQGQTPQEALANLETAARGWIQAVLDSGQEVPSPSITEEHSGKISLRLPRSLHRRAAQMAQRDGVSINLFIATAVAERVGAGHSSSREERQSAPPHVVVIDQGIDWRLTHIETHAQKFEVTPGSYIKLPNKATTTGGMPEDLQLPTMHVAVC